MLLADEAVGAVVDLGAVANGDGLCADGAAKAHVRKAQRALHAHQLAAVVDGRRLLAAAGAPGDEATVKSLRKTYDELYESDPTRLVEPYPGSLEQLRKVRKAGVKTAVRSNKPDNMTCFIADALFTGLFDVVHGQRAGIPKKPDPTAVRLLCGELGVTPGDCRYVGDSGVDMQTGANAGIVTAGVTWGFRGADELKENGAVHLADDAEALLNLIL